MHFWRLRPGVCNCSVALLLYCILVAFTGLDSDVSGGGNEGTTTRRTTIAGAGSGAVGASSGAAGAGSGAGGGVTPSLRDEPIPTLSLPPGDINNRTS